MPQPTHAQTPTIQISVINESTVLADADVVPVVAALQKQVTNDFRPVWGDRRRTRHCPEGHSAAQWDLVARHARRLRPGQRSRLSRSHE